MQATAARTQATTSAHAAPAPSTERPAEDTALAADLYALISHLHKNCNADLLEAVGAVELSLSQIKLLHHLEDAPAELTLKQGAEAIRVSLPAASRMVDDLVNRGLVVRHEDAEDRRMKRISLTEQGRVVIARLNAARLTGLESFIGILSGPERRALAQALDALLAREEIAALRPDVETAR